MSETEDFLNRYEKDILNRVILPKAIKEHIRLNSCLKAEEGREVYLVQDKDEKLYILKIRTSGRPDSLAGEYAVLQKLSHPQIPRAYFYMEENGKEYLLRTYIPGKSLQEAVNAKGRLGEEDSIRILLSLCGVIDYLHSCRPPVIHRDIKPQNVILTPEGDCALIDFGTARLYKKENKEDTVFLGTQATAPPEQFGYGQTDERADIYSLGILMRFLLTGSLEKNSDISVPAALKCVINKCTAFDPAKRYASIRRVAAALKYAQRGKRITGTVSAVFLAAVTLIAAGGILKNNSSAEFSNPLLEKAVRQELGIREEEAIPEKRLPEVRQIIICGNKVLEDWTEHDAIHYDMKNDSTLRSGRGDISDLDELRKLPSLEALVLDYQDITDISPLEGMELQYLSLCGNEVENLSALEEMTTLCALWLEDTPVSDGAVLSHLTSLRELEISGTNLAKTSDFCSLPLEVLKMKDTLITDLAPLRQLRELTVLSAGEADEQGMEIIQGMKQLEYLTVSGTLEDLTGFAGMHRLVMLDLSLSRLNSLEGVDELTNLEYLGLGYTKPDSLEPLTKNGALRDVEMVGADIKDYTPLLRCKGLHAVHVGLSRKEEATRQLEGSGLIVYAWEE